MKLLIDFLFFNFILFNIQFVVAQGSSTSYTIATFDASKLTGLSSGCQNVYNAVIPNCGMSDFLPTLSCSSTCISSLLTIQSEAQAACQDSQISSNSLLSSFVNGSGAQELCASQKATQATLATSIMLSSATATQQSQQSASSTAAAAIIGGDSMSISHGAVIAIVISVIVTSSVLIVIGTIIFRKNYG
jgi:hypothetical protein